MNHRIRIAGLALGALAFATMTHAEEAPETQAAEQFSKAFRRVARSAGPAVVSISTVHLIQHPSMVLPDAPDDPSQDQLPEPFRQFAPFRFRRGPSQPFEARGQGSGVIVDAAKGTILTNRHVVEGVDTVKVRLQDGREVEGKVLGTDPKTDVAVVRIAAEKLQAAPLGDSDAMEQGDWVVAIGAPFGLEQTMTAGIVSAKGRAHVNVIQSPYAEQDFIQTDAAINPGNSGGPLLNLKGEVIGINTAIAGSTGGNLGIGFAVPSNLAKRIIPQLIDKGRVVRGWVGVGIQELTGDLAQQFDVKEHEAVLVGQVMPDSPAEEGGLQSGDLIVGLGDWKVTDMKVLRQKISEAEVGSEIAFHVLRGGKEKTLTVKVGEQPGDEARDRVAEHTENGKEALGLSVQDISPDLAERLGLEAGEKGVVVKRVAPGSPASGKGIQPGAVILSVNRKAVGSAKEFRKAVADADPAKGVLLLVKEGDAASWVVLKPGD